MTPLEPNPLSIRHDVVFAEFRESSVECKDDRQKIANRLCNSTFYGIITKWRALHRHFFVRSVYRFVRYYYKL